MAARQSDVIVLPADPNCRRRLETELAARRRLLPTKRIRRFADLEAACSIIVITYLLTDGAVDTDELYREIKRKNPGLWSCLEQVPHNYTMACRDAAHLCSLPDHPPSTETTDSD